MTTMTPAIGELLSGGGDGDLLGDSGLDERAKYPT